MTDPVLLYGDGLGREVADTDTCSKCGQTIPEEHVPLILWNEGGERMWCYCEACEGPMFRALRPKAATA